MNIKRMGIVLGVFLLLALFPATSSAGLEVTGVVGTLLGGELDSILDDGFSISNGFENSPLYGVRATYMAGFIGVEGSYVTSPNGLDVTYFDFPISLDTRISYLEANVLLVPLPGPISPYATAGFGQHKYDFDLALAGFDAVEVKVDKTGYNFGAGVRFAFSKLVVRGEVRDHITKIGPEDFDLEDLADELGFDDEQTLHNVEISISAGVRF